MGEKSQSIGTIERALEILWIMYKENRELGVTEIAQSLDVYKSTVHRTLVALKKKGFVEQNPETGKYWLGLVLFSMGMQYDRKISLKDVCSPFIKRLADKVGETVNLGILDNNEVGKVVIIDKVETDQRLTLVPSVGALNHAHCSSMGKVLLSFSDNDYFDKFIAKGLKPFTNNTITEKEELKDELREVRNKGYAIDKEESEIGLMCVGAPIFDKNGVRAAISIAGPTQRFQGERLMEIIDAVKDTAQEISRKFKR